jgi:vesicle transport through interaction with t-SNAREs protein 1
MSTGIFAAYDAEFSALSQDIQNNTSNLRNNGAGQSLSLYDMSIFVSQNDLEKTNYALLLLKFCEGNPESAIRQIDALLSQAGDLIKQMNLEARSQDAATRKILQEKVTSYSKSLVSLRGDFERAKEQCQRTSLIGEKSAYDRQRLLDTNDK